MNASSVNDNEERVPLVVASFRKLQFFKMTVMVQAIIRGIRCIKD